MMVTLVAAAAISGFVVGPRTATKGFPRWAVLQMSVVTYALVILLLPLISAAAAWPSASLGGTIPCVHFNNTCPEGLSGAEALSRMATETATFYLVSPFSLVVLSPFLIVFAVPSALWAWLLTVTRRRLLGSLAADVMADLRDWEP
jgi:hypothetical protein